MSVLHLKPGKLKVPKFDASFEFRCYSTATIAIAIGRENLHLPAASLIKPSSILRLESKS